jgi:hypothetical protein
MRWLQGAVALSVGLAASSALAADHLDSKAATADPAADITDVYSWVEGSNMLFVLNVAPLATADSKFSNVVQYVIHTQSSAKFGETGDKVDIIATFDDLQKISLWIGDKDYVTGDASDTAGLKSDSGKLRVFAGLRADPFYFNLEGFKDAVATVDAAEAGLTFDGSKCPALDMGTSMTLVGMLQGTAKGTMPAKNFFATANVLSIVIELDKSLVTTSGPIVGVWGSTHKGG